MLRPRPLPSFLCTALLLSREVAIYQSSPSFPKSEEERHAARYFTACLLDTMLGAGSPSWKSTASPIDYLHLCTCPELSG